jgi:DNA-binding response OmpR family regulator
LETIVAVAEDASPIVAGLRLAGWRVRLVQPGLAMDEIGALSPDIVVLDLPSGDATLAALDVIASAVGLADVPLVAVLDPSDLRRVAVDRRLADFAARPPRIEELAVRLRRLLRPRAALAQGGEDGPLRIGPLAIDLRRFEATLDGAPIEFAYQEFQLLRFLVANPDQAFSRDQLLAKVWGWDYFGGPRTVDIHVRRVRAKLGTPVADWLETVRNVGYRWSPPPDAEEAGRGAVVSLRRSSSG